MEMEDEKTIGTNSAEDNDLNEDQYEITEEVNDSGDLDFEIVDFDVVEEDEFEKNNEHASGEFIENNLGDSDFDIVNEEDNLAEEVNLDFENDDKAFDNLPPLDESDLADIDLVEPLDDALDIAETIEQEDFFEKFSDNELSPLSFARKQLVIFGTAKEQADLLKKYLHERTGIEVESVSKKENLWRILKIDPLEMIILEAGTEGNTDAMELIQQTKDQFPDVHFICLSGPVSLERRLQFLNAGALDYLTRPIHLSTIAQSILVQYSRTDDLKIDDDFAGHVTELSDIPEEDPIINEVESNPENNSVTSAKQPDDEHNLADEIDLIEEDF